MTDTPTPRASRPIWLSRLFPFLVWWPRVNRQTMRADILAGITGAIVVLPQGVAFATIAGMPPEYGLYAGMVPAIIAALFGSSWHLVSGPTTAASVILYSSLSVYAEPGSAEFVQLALTLTLMVGVTQLALGLARLGVLVNFIAHAVLLGFTAGAAVLIAGKQLKNFFGVPLPDGGHLHDILIQLFGHLSDINLYVTAVSLATLLCGILVKTVWPRLPYLVVAMLAGTLLSVGLNIAFGVAVTGIQTVGALPASLPPLSAPSLSFETLRNLAPISLAVTLFALTEAVSIGRSLGMKSGQHINGNQEFIGQGLSNIVGSFFSGYVATGSFNRSAANYQAGAETPMAAIFAGVLLIGLVPLVGPLAAYLPNAAMAGLLFLVAWRLIDFHHIGHILKNSRPATATLTVTFFATLFLGVDFAIFLGVLLALVIYLKRTSRPNIYPRVPDPNDPGRRFVTDANLPECPQLKFLRIDGSLYFGAVDHVQEQLRRFEERDPEQKHLAILAQGINFIDLTGAEFLTNEVAKRRARGGDVYLAGAKLENFPVVLERGGYLKKVGMDHIFGSKAELIAGAFARLDRDICRTCRKRIFRECASVPGPDDLDAPVAAGAKNAAGKTTSPGR